MEPSVHLSVELSVEPSVEPSVQPLLEPSVETSILINCFGTTSQVDTCNTQTIASLTSDVIVSQNLSENCYLTSAQGALPESALVSDLLTEGSQISVAMNLCGGGKKKQFSTPKKNKHKKKKIFLKQYFLTMLLRMTEPSKELSEDLKVVPVRKRMSLWLLTGTDTTVELLILL